MRLKLFFLAFSSILLIACGAEDTTEPPAELIDFESSAVIEELWDVSTGSGVNQHYLKLYPLLLSDRIVLADRNGTVKAVDLDDGDELWSVDLDVVISGGVGGNEKFHSVTSRDGDVFLLDAENGDIKWQESVATEVLVPAEIVRDRLVMKTVDGKIIALDLATGKQQWVYKRDVPALSLRGGSRLIVVDDKILTGLDSGRLVALDVTGKSLFDAAVAIPRGKSELERIVDIDGDAVFKNNILYIASYQGSVIAIDIRRGQLIWKRKLSTYTGVEVDQSTLFSADERDYIWALDRANGATLWKMEKLSARRITRPVAMSDAIVVCDSEGYLHWISQYDGRFLARKDTGTSGCIVPPVVRGNQLYVLSRDGELNVYQYIKNN
ncbi:MAG: outer membrane protein assembly factor BamB [Gammaproteobacteria bacterium]|nr:outer membrane protein assembly factor BamB [Gammaproteobacteria bacterium]